MNLAPRTLLDWLRPVFQRFFLFGMQITTEEAATDLLDRGHSARKRGLQSTLESLDFADALPDGDDYRKQAIALFKEATVEQTRVVQALSKTLATPGDVEGALARPFSVASTSETPSLPEPGVEGPEADGPTEPEKRPRGRPRKDRTGDSTKATP